MYIFVADSAEPTQRYTTKSFLQKLAELKGSPPVPKYGNLENILKAMSKSIKNKAQWKALKLEYCCEK